MKCRGAFEATKIWPFQPLARPSKWSANHGTSVSYIQHLSQGAKVSSGKRLVSEAKADNNQNRAEY